MVFRSVKFLSIMLCFAITLASCATSRVQDSGRKGLFGYFSGLKAGSGRKKSLREVEDLREDVKEVVSDWRWPLDEVEVTSPFGSRSRRFHEGVDLKAHVGTKVMAAHDGSVVYAGNKISGYGWMIVLKDKSGIMSVYAHHQKILVKKGQRITKGQLIAYSGKSGRVTGPHLHFELRKGIVALNPEDYLPDGGVKLAYVR